jgi:PAS domain-containing protein
MKPKNFLNILGDNGRWLIFTAAPIKASDGTVVGAIETLWDTTDKKRVEAEHRRDIIRIEESENRLSQIIQGSTIPTFVLNRDHVITTLEPCPGAPERTSRPRKWWAPASPVGSVLEQGTAHHGRRHTGSAQRAGNLGAIRRQMEKSDLIDGAYEAEVFFPKMGKGGKWLFFTAAPIRATDGSVTGAIETFWDITEKKEAEVQQASVTPRC